MLPDFGFILDQLFRDDWEKNLEGLEMLVSLAKGNPEVNSSSGILAYTES